MRTIACVVAIWLVLGSVASAQFWQPREPEKDTNVSLTRDVSIEQKLNEQVPLDLTFRARLSPIVVLVANRTDLQTIDYCPDQTGVNEIHDPIDKGVTVGDPCGRPEDR